MDEANASCFLVCLCRGVVRVGQWVQLHPSILKKVKLHSSIFVEKGLKGNLPPWIEISNSLLGILHPLIEIPNDAPGK